MASKKSYYITEKALHDQEDNPRIKKLYFDAIKEFTPTKSQSLSRYALSDNSTITNHVVKDPVTISVTGVVSASPLSRYTNDYLGYDALETRPTTGYNVLSQWWQDNTLLYLENEHDSYNGYILTKLTPVQSANDSLTFQMTFEKAKFVGYQRVKLYQYADADVVKDASTTESERVTPDEPERTSNTRAVLESTFSSTWNTD